jgi:septal ring factor EnvC (AmiA/AmiB activator)
MTGKRRSQKKENHIHEEKRTMERQCLANYSIGGLVTLLVGSITWLFVSVHNNAATIQELTSVSEQSPKLWQQIGELKEDIKEIDTSIGQLTATTAQTPHQWQEINRLKERLDTTSDKVAYLKGERIAFIKNMEDIRELRKLVVTQVKELGDIPSTVAMDR